MVFEQPPSEGSSPPSFGRFRIPPASPAEMKHPHQANGADASLLLALSGHTIQPTDRSDDFLRPTAQGGARMAMTMAEKILARAAGRPAVAPGALAGAAAG